ncbi:MAG TPA: hypothetical protein VHM90_19465 [Phycisphaerae bacterium]|nr:hypothetical protein [Phycisphaerae bacterium]
MNGKEATENPVFFNDTQASPPTSTAKVNGHPAGMKAASLNGKTKTNGRLPDHTCDALVRNFPDVYPDGKVPDGDRGKVNTAVKKLKDFGATPDAIDARVAAFRKQWPNATCTPMSIPNNWTTLGGMLNSKSIDGDKEARFANEFYGQKKGGVRAAERLEYEQWTVRERVKNVKVPARR